MLPPVEIIGRLEIHPAVLEHRFVLEAMAATKVMAESDDGDNRVIGTNNTGSCELYGWNPNVPEHADRTGWVYLVPATGSGLIVANQNGQEFCVLAEPGDVVRLNDFQDHFTHDDGPRLALFVGAFCEPDDERAKAILAHGLAALAEGLYYGAPRVRGGFQALLEDECLACTDAEYDTVEPMLTADARAQGRLILQCGQCDALAVQSDPHFPYHQDRNRCRQHLTA